MANASASRDAFTFVWTVENFSRSIELQYFLSPRFLVNWEEKIMFHLAFKAMDNVDCILGAGDNSTLKDVEIDCELSLIDAKGRPLVTKKGQKSSDQNYAYVFPSLVRKIELLKRMSEYLPNDTLSFRCSLRKAGATMERPVLCFGRSEVGTDSYFWSIKRFSHLKIGKKKCFELQPKLHVIPTLIVECFLSSGGEYVQIEISCGNEEVYNDTKWEISLIDYEGKVFAFENWNWKCGFEREVHFFPKFITRTTLMGKKSAYLPNDVLLFRCECTRVMSEILFDNQVPNTEGGHESEEKTQVRPRSISVPNPCTTSRKSISIEMDCTEIETEDNFSSHLRQDIRSLFDDETLSDVELRAGSETFQVHSAVLGARSPVFKDKFRSYIEEKEKKVESLELNSKTLRKLLLYIYTDHVEDLRWEEAAELYSGASKYKLAELENICSNILMANLCITTACDTLVLIQKDESLKTVVKDFFLENGSDIIRSEDWKVF